MTHLARFSLVLVLALVGCGDSESTDSDAAPSFDATGSATIDAAPDVDAAPIVDAAPACLGVEVAGACWYKGSTGESCTDVCASHGGFDQATITFAGSISNGDRSNAANCSSVATALSAEMFSDSSDNLNETNDYGCIEEPGKMRSELISVNATQEASSNVLAARICACNN